ncbi:MAG TPA: iron ABC transporter permease [Puia sp.]|uniref:FecCD family ABC transporter permease n=1 Tax=Puia sp. TaxID=2045100 RepID=UPI002B82630F|nr:iron ABC transporter permease [Puia sp.]HVU96550.1 iron ABC transporter permease [Puia sp.]
MGNRYYWGLGALLLVSLLVSARVGAVSIPYDRILLYLKHAVSGGNAAASIEERLFLQIRLPRVLLCAFTGAALAVSGALMQALFRNPIVEPGLVGTSSGAAFGAAFVFVMGKNLTGAWVDAAGPFLLPLFAFAGGGAATWLVYRLSNVFGKVNVNTLLLAGIAVNALAAGGTGFFSYIARDPQARSIVFWNLGTLSGADWSNTGIVAVSTVAGIALSLGYAKALNALMLGETEAGYLGVRTTRLKGRILLINTFMVAVATSVVGVIAFVGLVVPHILRLLKSADNRFLIIASALLGAILLNFADMLARVIVAPSEFPIGVLTAVAGAPVFLYLLIRAGRRQQEGGFYA